MRPNARRQGLLHPRPPTSLGKRSRARSTNSVAGSCRRRRRYSAKKIGGIAAHRLARRDKPVQPAPVSVTVSELTLVDFEDGLVSLRVTASAGFYVRSLAHDLGARLGCGAHLEALRRTRAGAFGIAEATALEVVESEGLRAAERIVPLDALLPELPAVAAHRGWRQARLPRQRYQSGGRGLAGARWRDAEGPATSIRLLDPSGRLLGIARQGAGGALRPAVVLV